jgi:predicted RNA binding protein YcfA (HicA-like mRNA interferase family)
MGGKGSHRKFRHGNVAGSVILSGNEVDDAKQHKAHA